MNSRFVRAFAVGIVLLHAKLAAARCCATNNDCPRGVPCSNYTNADGGENGMCAAEFAACHCDADCAPGMRCLAQSSLTECVIDAGTQTCSELGQCTVAWRGPCKVDSDCGIGFQCTIGGGSVCSASGCQQTSMCVQTAPSSPCTFDTDCPSGWTCENAAVACKPFSTFGPTVPSNPYPNEMLCYPPYYDVFDNSVMLNVGDPATAYSPCLDGGVIVSSGGTGGVSGIVGDSGAVAIVNSTDSGGPLVLEDAGARVAKNTTDSGAPTASQDITVKLGCGCTIPSNKGTRRFSQWFIIIGLLAARRQRKRAELGTE